MEHDHLSHLSEEIQNACMALPLYRFTQDGHVHENQGEGEGEGHEH